MYMPYTSAVLCAALSLTGCTSSRPSERVLASPPSADRVSDSKTQAIPSSAASGSAGLKPASPETDKAQGSEADRKMTMVGDAANVHTEAIVLNANDPPHNNSWVAVVAGLRPGMSRLEVEKLLPVYCKTTVLPDGVKVFEPESRAVYPGITVVRYYVDNINEVELRYGLNPESGAIDVLKSARLIDQPG